MDIAEKFILDKKPRHFIPKDLDIDNWDILSKYFEDLKNRPLDSLKDLERWLEDKSEIESVLQEDVAWRYIRMSIDTTNDSYRDAFNFFITEIEPKLAPYDDLLNRKLLACPFIEQLPEDYNIYIRQVRKKVEIFREENIPLLTELQKEEQEYAAIVGQMTITYNGEEYTMPRAANLLKDTDRKVREEVYLKIVERRLQDRDKLDELYTRLVRLRHKVAVNAGFKNFRDYMFAALGRFDYTVQDCFNFHEAIKTEIVPVTEQLQQARKKALGYQVLKPWDLEVDPSGKPALKPFKEEHELMDKTIECFYRLNSFLGRCMDTLKAMKHVDLDSRKGKAPGGFNYPLYETGVPFIFMNGSNSLRDIITMVHEGGHAVHSILNRELPFIGFKNIPSEIAELASMSMELMSMEHWDVYFPNPEELKRARKQQIEKVIETLPWIATIDKFQHWVYENPEHTSVQRSEAWTSILKEFGGKQVDWTSLEDSFASSWQKQLHLYQVPFYYIEYGMAQLGAIAVWRNFKEDAGKALSQYINALSLGYKKSIPEVYKEAGIQFNFSKEYVHELSSFLKEELDKYES